MDDQIWFYLIAAILYFLTRRKKKKTENNPKPASRPNTRQQESRKPVSFEDLLKEITEEREEQSQPTTVESRYDEREESVQEKSESIPFDQEGNTRVFADDESKRIYEESIQRAEEINHKYERDEHYRRKGQLIGSVERSDEHESKLAAEIREGLQSTDSARKAIIYAEILNRKY